MNRYKIYHKEKEQWLAFNLVNGKIKWGWVNISTDWFGEDLIKDMVNDWLLVDISNQNYGTIHLMDEFFSDPDTGGWCNVMIVPLIHGEPDFTKAMETI